jgi:hypothetical protein
MPQIEMARAIQIGPPKSFGTIAEAAAFHHLHSRQIDGSYTLDWRGRIALSYSGHTDFEHSFHARVRGVTFDSIMLFYFNVERAKEYDGIDLDPTMSARDYIAPFVV